MNRICPHYNKKTIRALSLIGSGIVNPATCPECDTKIVLNWMFSAFQGVTSMAVLIIGFFTCYKFGNLYPLIFVATIWILLTYWCAKIFPLEIRKTPIKN